MRGFKKAISIVAIVILALAGYLFYKNSDFFAPQREKTAILEKISQADQVPLTETEKKALYLQLQQTKNQKYGFSDEEKARILKALNQ